MSNNDSFPVRIVTRDEVLFEGDVKALSSQNKVGKFDVLPIHANFISLLDGYINLYKMDGTTQEIRLNDGVIRVVDGRVEVFLGVRADGKVGS